MTKSFDLPVLAIDQFLNVTFEVCPTPLQSFAIEVHLRPVAIDDDARIVSHQRLQGSALACQEDSENGEPRSHRNPQPSFTLFLFGRRLVHEQLLLILQFAA